MVATFNLYFGVVRRVAQVDANASGATLGTSAGLVSGVATGDAQQNGATLTAMAAVLSGTAAAGGAANGQAQGTTLEAVASLIAGTATGDTEVTVIFGGGGGRFIERRKDAVAYGRTLTCFARIVAGHVSTVSLLAGEAFGDATAGNDNLEAAALLIPGTATGERNFADDELLMIFAEAA
jgi:hypothetical protein